MFKTSNGNQMGRIHTKFVLARVVNFLASWHGAVLAFVVNDMRPRSRVGTRLLSPVITVSAVLPNPAPLFAFNSIFSVGPITLGRESQSRRVSLHKTNVLTADHAGLAARFFRNRRNLTTSAHAQPGWIGRWKNIRKTLGGTDGLHAARVTTFRAGQARCPAVETFVSLFVRHLIDLQLGRWGVVMPGALARCPAFRCPNYTGLGA